MSKKEIRIVVSNRTANLLRPYPHEKLIKHWSYTVPGFMYIQRFRPGWDGRIKLLKWEKVPTGLFLATREEIEKDLGWKFHAKFIRTKPDMRPKEKWLASDRIYQNECVDRMVENGRCGGLILSATGTGKTYVTALYTSRVEGPHLFVVDQLDLLWQAKEEIEDRLHEKVGYVGNQKFRPRRVTIGTVQTMHKHRHDRKFSVWTDDIQAVIIDEIHTQLNKRNFDVVENIQPRACFGLTATLQLKRKPVRLKAYGLCGPVIYEFPVKKGMDENVLSKGVVIRCRIKNEVG